VGSGEVHVETEETREGMRGVPPRGGSKTTHADGFSPGGWGCTTQFLDVDAKGRCKKRRLIPKDASEKNKTEGSGKRMITKGCPQKNHLKPPPPPPPHTPGTRKCPSHLFLGPQPPHHHRKTGLHPVCLKKNQWGKTPPPHYTGGGK